MMLIRKELIEIIQNQYEIYKDSEEFPSIELIDEKINLFQEKFDPNSLNINGKELLLKMHRPLKEGEEQSLVYWLEKKEDEEFPSHFGNVSVGNAGQYRVYFSPKDDTWRNKDIKKISEEKAIELAEKNRNLLKKASDMCGNLLKDKTLENYKKFDKYIKEEVTELCNNQWMHKYLFLINPDKLSDIHSQYYLLHMLLKLGIKPENPKGYYELDYYLIKIAEELEIKMTYLTHILFKIFSKPYEYWIFQLNDAIKTMGIKEDNNYISYMKNKQVICLGMPELGDLEDFSNNGITKFIKNLEERIEEHSLRSDPTEIESITRNYANFLKNCGKYNRKDIIILVNERKILGIGKLTGKTKVDYKKYEEYPYQRKVDWLLFNEQYPIEIPLTKYWFSRIRKPQSPEYVIKLESIIKRGKNGDLLKKIYDLEAEQFTEEKIKKIEQKPAQISSILEALERKKQVILYGPPGTGKTYWAIKAAEFTVAYKEFEKHFDNLTIEEQKEVYNYISKCCFHPSYGYEDFIIGYQPGLKDNKLIFTLQNGIFKELCDEAYKKENENKNYYLIVDEINRGDIPRIFGELMMIIESDKRNEELQIPISKIPFKIPPNIYIIGTMNTADRSIALIDTALRRRFAFIEFMPDYSLIKTEIEYEESKFSLDKWLYEINTRIKSALGKDGRNLQIGHAYLLKKEGVCINTIEEFATILRQDIIPLLEEYCYGDYETLANILGRKIIDINEQVINEDLFDSDNFDKLIRAIIKAFPMAEELELESTQEEKGEEEIFDE